MNDFNDGYLAAVQNLSGGFNMSILAGKLLKESGIPEKDAKRAIEGAELESADMEQVFAEAYE